MNLDFFLTIGIGNTCIILKGGLAKVGRYCIRTENKDK